MPNSLVKGSELTLSQADLPRVDTIKPEGFKEFGDTKFEVTDTTEQGKVKDRLQKGVGSIAESIFESSKGLFEKHEVTKMNIDGTPVVPTEKVTVEELLEPKSFVDYTPGHPDIKLTDAVTYVKNVYGKDPAGHDLVENLVAYVESLPPAALKKLDKFIVKTGVTDAQKKEILKDTLVLTLAGLDPETAHLFIKDLSTGRLNLVDNVPTTGTFGAPIMNKVQSPYAPRFLESLAFSALKVKGNATVLKPSMKSALNMGGIGFSTVPGLLSQANYKELNLSTGADTTGWTDDGEILYNGIAHLIDETVKDPTISFELKTSVVKANVAGNPGNSRNDLEELYQTILALKEVNAAVSTDVKSSVKQAKEILQDNSVKAGLEVLNPSIRETVEANLNPQDTRRVQATGIRALDELFPTAGGPLTLTDTLPWNEAKTWQSVADSLREAIADPTQPVKVQEAMSLLEKIALFGPAGVKDTAKNYFYEMMAQQLLTYPEARELINQLDGHDLSDYGEIMYKFLTDSTAPNLDGDRNNAFVKASEYWLAVLQNFENFEDLQAKNSAGTLSPQEQVQYGNLLAYAQIEDSNMITYAMEGALEKVQELQKEEIARALGLDPDDLTVQKILNQKDSTNAMNDENEKMKSIFEKVKGKAFAVATALALTTVAIATGGGLVAGLLYLGAGVAAVLNAKKQAGGWKSLAKGMWESVKSSMSYLFSLEHTAKEKWLYAGVAVFGGMARYLWPGGGAVAAGLVELGAAVGFEVNIGKKQAELAKALTEAYEYAENNPDVSITPAGGTAINVKFAPYLKQAVRYLDEIKKNSTSYDETVQLDAMISAGGELEKAALVFKHFKEKRDALEVATKYDAVNKTLGAYNAMLAGVIAGNVLAMGTRLVGAIDAQGAEFRENVVKPATSPTTSTDEIDSATRNYQSMAEQAEQAKKWNEYLEGQKAMADNTGGGSPDTLGFDVTTRGALNLPGSAWNGTTMGALDGYGDTPANPSLFHGGVDGMAATYFHQGALDAGGPDYINKLFNGDVSAAHKVLNEMKSEYTSYYGGGKTSLDYTFADAYKNVMGVDLP